MYKIFGDRLKYYRNKEGLFQKDVAEVVGVKANTVCGWENSNTEPKLEQICKLADFFKVTPNDLLGY